MTPPTLGQTLQLIQEWQDSDGIAPVDHDNLTDKLLTLDLAALTQQAAQHAQTLRRWAEHLQEVRDYRVDNLRAVADWLAPEAETP